MPPRISIVVPTYNRPNELKRCLTALAAQDLAPDEFEVLVVDDGSRESAEGVISKVRSSTTIRLLRQENAGPAVARNLAAQHARGEFLAFTDDDCEPAPNWLRALLDRLRANPRALVGGRTINALENNKYSATSQLLIDFLYERYTGSRGTTLFFASNNFAMERSLFLARGGFTSTRWRAAEDREFCHLWHQDRLPAVFAPEALVRHAHRLTLSSFWLQHFMYGRGAFQFRTALVARGDRPMKVEPLSFYRSLLFYPFHCQQNSRAFERMVLMAISQIANVAGFGCEALFGRRRGALADENSRSAHAFASGTIGEGVAADRAVLGDASIIATNDNVAAPTT
jgi:glycosyltransferase involved in cell wall biosynthesis